MKEESRCPEMSFQPRFRGARSLAQGRSRGPANCRQARATRPAGKILKVKHLSGESVEQTVSALPAVRLGRIWPTAPAVG